MQQAWSPKCLPIWFGVGILLAVASISVAEDKPKKADSLSVADPLTKRTLGKLTKMETSVLYFTNLARKQRGKPSLTAVSHLNVVAQRHAINMARQQKMEHTLDEKTCMDRIKAASYQCQAYAENIATGYLTGKTVVQGWLKSPGHRKNLLDENDVGYNQIGIGAYRDVRGRWYFCQVFARPAPGKAYE